MSCLACPFSFALAFVSIFKKQIDKEEILVYKKIMKNVNRFTKEEQTNENK